jgi:hypothetical protein
MSAAVVLGFTIAWYGWLSLPDSTGLYLTVQAVAAIGLWLAAAGFYAGLTGLLVLRSQEAGQARLRQLWRPGLRPWLTAVLILLMLAIALGCGNWLKDACLHTIWKIPSWLTLKLNRPVRIAPFVKAVQILFGFLLWGVLPALATMLLTARERGYGLWSGWRIAHLWRLWAITALTLIVLEVLPWQLAHWVPHMHSALGELFCAIARIGAAVLLAVMGWLLLLALWIQAVQEQAPRT